MPFTYTPPPPPPPDLWDEWLRNIQDILPTLTWQAEQSDLGRWFTEAGEPCQLVATTDSDGRLGAALMKGLQPDRIDLLMAKQTATIARQGRLAAKPSTAVEHNGSSFVFRLQRSGAALELVAVAV